MKLIIRNEHGEALAYSWVPSNVASKNVVVIGHGVTSDKDRPWSIELSLALAEQGISSLRLAFSGNGASEGAFADSNITKEARDLGSVLDVLNGAGFKTAYVGQSMGAAVGVTRAATDPRIVALVSLAGMVHTTEFVERMFGHLSPGQLMLDKPKCPLSATYVADLKAIDTLIPLAPQIQVPWLLVHGDADDVVPISHSRDIAAAHGSATLHELPGIDHPFTPPGIEQMTSIVAPWLADHFA